MNKKLENVNKINCEYLDLLFNKNIAILYQNIVYKSLETSLIADRLEIDLITKNSKISMNNKKEKIEIVYKEQNGNFPFVTALSEPIRSALHHVRVKFLRLGSVRCILAPT